MIRHIRSLIAASVLPSDIAVMVRSNQLVYAMQSRLERNGLQVLSVTTKQPDDKSIPGVRLMTMHRGKGMEYSYVCLPCLCADIIPSKRDIEKATDSPVPITVSVGVSKYNGDFEKTIVNVDNALYKAKNTGRNKVVVV